MNNPLELSHVVLSTREILAQLLAIDTDEISPESSLIDDLSADSLDIVDLSFQLGRHFGCTLPKTSVLDHAKEVCGDLSDFANPQGITALGKALLESSLSAYPPGQLQVGMRPWDVFAQTTVLNWAQQCHQLFNYLPQTCPQCGGSEARLHQGHQVVCTSCSARLTPADGDDVSRQLVQRFVAQHLAMVD